MTNELYHYGIEGMRWGVRRYQNKDGTLTELGKRRLGQDKSIKLVSGDDGSTRVDSNDSDSVYKAHTKIRNEVSVDNNQLSKAQRSGADTARIASDMVKRSANKGRSKAVSKIDLSEMTDAELRAKVNRMNLERQYKNLQSEKVSLGRDKVSEVISGIGDAISIGANIASIASSIALILK